MSVAKIRKQVMNALDDVNVPDVNLPDFGRTRKRLVTWARDRRPIGIETPVTRRSGRSRGVWILLAGVGAGAAAAYLLDPVQGARRRSTIKDFVSDAIRRIQAHQSGPGSELEQEKRETRARAVGVASR